ncbi:MAG: primosomal protein N', partial [Clostridia bacterium]|nr:primosomal protein N' [Clostridia bacterium]
LKKVKLNENIDLTKLTKRQREVVDLLQEKFKDGAFLKEIQYYLGTSASVIENLEKKGFVNVFYEDFYRDPYKNRPFEVKKEEINLSVEQNEVYASLYDLYMKEKYEVSLLYGVTGSGKTSVFLKLVDKACKDNKGVIVMVPEIALTPQMVNLFKSRYGNKVAVFHSGLSAGERLDEYKKVKRNEANVVIGTRSAVFAPVKDLSLIVIDEEHETTYKSEQTPRYNAKEVAKFRCFHNNGLLILSSATPSVEDFYLAKNGRYHLHKISSRYSSAKLPEVSIVDMNLERENGNISSFSRFLIDELARNIENNQQSILLLNRRGYNTFISCRNCKEVISCPNCSISLIYHSANNRLMCHYCGHSTSLPQVCPRCKEPTIKYMGLGIQKAEEELKNLFPNAKILRMDSDSVAGKFSYEKKLNEFLSGNYQIMLGTQMISKGLNFPNVTLVGVLSSDQSLFSDDFRSYERTFSLLTQVIGRSGRFQKTGKAIIQTFSPEHLVINLAKKQDYEKFYNSEIKMRKAMLYPPFVNLCLVGFAATNEKNVLEISQDFLREFISLVKSEYINMPLKVLGPSPANILKLDNKFRYKIIIKCLNNKDFRNLISKLLIKFSDKKVNKNVSLYIDFNPEFVV